jgi:uncharacterized DUF497 family protein
MTLCWDEAKRQKTLKERGLDFARCEEVLFWPGSTLDYEDDSQNYGEQRWITVGFLETKLVLIVRTEPDDEHTRIISMRYASRSERRRYEKEMG